MRNFVFACVVLSVVGVLGCGAAEVKQEEPLFQPKFSYNTKGSGAKIDVTVGLVAPQFGASGATFWAQNKNDEVVRGFVNGLRSGFNELLVAKGFNVAGPFDSVANMTFPEKKGSDFVLFPVIEIEGGMKIENISARTDVGIFGNTVVNTCNVVLGASGQISIVVVEPLSGEKMWYKVIPDLGTQPKVMKGEGQICTGAAGGLPRQLKNDWGRMYQDMYNVVMKSLDTYVNGEEFQMLKRQSAELRAKKTY